MNRIYLTLAAFAIMTASQAQAFHPCRIAGGGTQSFSVAPGQSAQSFSFVQPQVQSFSFVQPQVQSFGFVQPQVQSFLVQSQTLNQNNNTSGSAGISDSQALSPALLGALRIACNLVGANVGGGGGGGGNANATELATLTNEIKALRDDQKAIVAELKKLSAKLPKSPKTPAKTGETAPEPKKKPNVNKNTDGNKSSAETPCEFKQLRERAELLAAGSVQTEVVVLKVSK